jgi:PAS domain S-box-containing protein
MALAGAISLSALLGWLFNSTFLKGVMPDWTPMKVITALCLAFFSAALALLVHKMSQDGRVRRASQVLGALISLVGLLTLAVYAVESWTGAPAALGQVPGLGWFLSLEGRMAAITGGVFVLMGCVLALLATGGRRAVDLGHALILPVAVASYLVLVSYLFGAQRLHGFHNVAMALNTGLAFCALCLAVFCMRPDTWLMSVFTADRAGSRMVRQLLPALFLLPLGVGWLRIYGERAGLFQSEVGVILVALIYTVFFLGFVWLSGRSVNRADEAIRQRNERLDLLAETAALLLSSEVPERIVQSLCEKVMRHLDCQAFFNYLVEDGKEHLRLNAWAGIPEKTAREIERLDFGVAVCGCVAREGRRIVAEDIPHTPDQRTDLVRSFGIQAYACHPLVYQGRIIGTLSFGTATRAHFAAEELELMKAVADLAATAMARKRTEEALAQSEQHVRKKLESLLSPEGDIGGMDLADIIEAPAIQQMMDDFQKLANIPMAVIDLKGKVLVAVGWQDICTKFHRVHPETCRNCVESDTQLSSGVASGECRLYKCKNNMWDAATPIMVSGKHVGNVFCGQFFFEDEALDRELFRQQAGRYGFPEAEYLSALDRVRRLSRAQVDAAMGFFLKLAHNISQLSWSNIQIAREVTERKRNEEALRSSEARLARTQEIAHLGGWELDLIKNELTWSDEVYRIFGLQPQEFAATYEAFLEVVHPEDRAAVDAAYSGSLREGRDSYEIEHRIIRKATGEVRFIHEKCEHVRDGSGRIIRSVGMVNDVTERNKKEAELRQLNRTLRALSRSDQALMHARSEQAYLDEVCSIVVGDCGHAMAWVGFAEQDEAKTVRPAASAGFEKGYIKTLRVTWADTERGCGPTGTAIRTGKPSSCRNMLTDPQFEPWRAEAIKRGYASSLVLPLLEEGKVFGAISIYSKDPDPFSDRETLLLCELAGNLAHGVTTLRLRVAHAKAEEARNRQAEEIKAYAARLEAANKELEAFSYSVSHDLRAPLRHIDGFVDLLGKKATASLDEQSRRYLGLISDSAKRMGTLIDDLLAFSRIGRSTMRRSTVDLDALVREVRAEVQKDAESRAIEWKVSQLPKVKGDPALLRVALSNLLANAIKFTRQRERAVIEVGTLPGTPGRAEVFVRDNGAGFDMRYVDKLFGVFQRLHRSEEFEGTGIGLATVRRIIARHDGTVRAEGALGQGASFYFSLPCE